MIEEHILQAAPRLRSDLRFSLQDGKDRAYIIEDPLRRKYYRIGNEEYLLFALLNGTNSFSQALSRINSLLNRQVFDHNHAKAIFDWLVRNQLVSDDTESMRADRTNLIDREKRLKNLSRLNFLTFKIPLGNPDRLFTTISPWCMWLVGKGFLLVWFVLFVYALTILSDTWVDFLKQTTLILTPGNLLPLWFAWFFLKIIHEIFHALVCYRYHGRVDEAGLMFILFVPLTFVNASSSWRFPSRWQRIHAAVAGMYAEVFIAAMAIVVWAGAPHTIQGEIAHNIVIIAGFSSIFFNANPLMRFDGYFILSDLLDIPNLYARGQEFTNSLFSAIFLRQWTYIARFSPGREVLIAIYGLASWIWRIVVLATLVYLASHMFHGLGIIIAIPAAIYFLGMPLWSLKARLSKLRNEQPGRFSYFLLCSTCISALLFVVLGYVDFGSWRYVPAIVQYTDEHNVKVDAPGIVSEIFVECGQVVVRGEPLLQLQNTDLVLDLKNTQLSLQILELKERNSLIKQEVSLYQVLVEQKVALQQKLAVLEKDVAALTVRAPARGTVQCRRLNEKLGAFVSIGQDLLDIVSEKDKKLVASVSQDDIAFFRQEDLKTVDILEQNSWHTAFSATISSIHPKADKIIPSPALSAAYGGPIAVQQAQVLHSEHQGVQRYEFLAPRFSVDLEIPKSHAERQPCGLLLNIRIEGPRATVWQYFVKTLAKRFSTRN